MARQDRGNILMLSRGVSVQRVGGSKDWYVYRTRRTGMWTWTPRERMSGPFRDKQQAILSAQDINSRAPVPWGEPGYKYIQGDGPHGDPRYVYPDDDVPLTIGEPMRRYRRRNPMTSTEDLALAGAAVAVAGLIGYAIYSKTKATTTAAAANPLINAPQSQATLASMSGTNAGIAAAQGQSTYGNTGDN